MVFTAGSFGKGAPVAISLGVALSTTLIGGMIANKLSIDRRNAKSNALLNFSDGKSVLSLPPFNQPKLEITPCQAAA